MLLPQNVLFQAWILPEPSAASLSDHLLRLSNEEFMKAAAAEKMQCMEVWGGNRPTWSQFNVPGLDVWVYSQPVGSGAGGGDVYYLSSCASGRITRMILADVCGHGDGASGLAVQLRDLMRQNVNRINQSHVAEELNRRFEAESETGRFATAVISTFFSPTRTWTGCNAGHPVPLVYRAAEGQWKAAGELGGGDGKGGVPIGVIEEARYPPVSIQLNVGDMILTYTDSFYEARDQSGQLLSTEGICRILNEADSSQPATLIPRLLEAVANYDAEGLRTDDTTAMLVRANGSGVPLKDNLLAPARYVGRLLGLC